MSLKYTLLSETLTKGSKEEIQRLLLNKRRIEIANNVINGKAQAPDDMFTSVGKQLKDTLCHVRGMTNQVIAEQKNKERTIHMFSDREWKFYPEEINDETGLTKYNREAPVTIKVDKKYPFLKDVKVSDQIKDYKKEALKELRDMRKARKEVPFQEKEFTIPNCPVSAKYKVYAGGGYAMGSTTTYYIHMEPGFAMKLKEAARIRKVFEIKLPQTNANHVGVEIEFICKKDKYEVAQLLIKYGVEQFVNLKDDGSLRSEKEYKFTHELCVLAPEALIHDVMRKVINALDEAESKVNSRCGLHVHLDMRSRDKKLVFNNLVKSQRILYDMNPRSRLDGTTAKGDRDEAYSKRVESSDFDQALGSMRNKYYGINPMTYDRLKTIEVRIHSGSTNFVKISNWIAILTTIANATKMQDEASAKPETFCKRYGFNDDMLEYIKERTKKFLDNNGKHVTLDEAS